LHDVSRIELYFRSMNEWREPASRSVESVVTWRTDQSRRWHAGCPSGRDFGMSTVGSDRIVDTRNAVEVEGPDARTRRDHRIERQLCGRMCRGRLVDHVMIRRVVVDYAALEGGEQISDRLARQLDPRA